MAKKIQNLGVNKEDSILVRSITNFLNKEYKEYSKYVISTRAIPSLVDGMKVGARKILHASFNGGMKNGKEVKNLNLVGDVYNLTLYNHGDISLHGTIFTLSQFFKDNLNPLSINGQCGSLRDENSISAPRYLHVKLSKYANLLYKTDYDLLEYVFDEGQYVEPKNYLPIIPTVLTSRSEGMAPGYRFGCFSYNPLDVIDACIDVLCTKTIKRKITPYIRGIKKCNIMWDDSIQRFVNYGEFTTNLKQDVLTITDLPYNIGYSKIEDQLNKLLDSGVIKDWKNYSCDDKIEYHVHFFKNQLSNYLNDDKIHRLIKMLLLSSVIPENTLNVLDEHQHLKYFSNVNDLIKYFVNFRLSKYNERKKQLVKVMNQRLIDNTAICRFIELVNDGEIIITNRKKSSIKKELDIYNLPHTVLSIAVSKLTNEEKKELLIKNKEIEKELRYIERTSIQQMYLNDLIELYKHIKEDF